MSQFIAEARVSTASAAAHISRLFEDMSRLEIPRIVLTPEAGRAEFAFGTAVLTAEPGALLMRAEAAGLEKLATLKFVLSARLEDIAAGDKPEIVWTGDGADATVLPGLREMSVRRVADLTAHMRRITFACDDAARYEADSFHVRLLIPPQGLAEPEWPVPGKNGRPAWPPEGRRPASRTYTVRRVDVAAGEIDIDFVMHGDEGVASAFAARAQPGDRVAMLGPGGRPLPEADWYLFVGDETALPAISRHLERLPASARGIALIEVEDARDELPLRTAATIDIVWLHRDGAMPGTSTLLEERVRAVEWPKQARVYGWLGTESATARSIRRTWRQELALTREQHQAVAYWRLGAREGEASATAEKDD